MDKMSRIVVLLFIVFLMACTALTTKKKIRDIKIGTLHRKETESLLHVLEYVFNYVLPKKLQLEKLRFSLIHVKVDGKDLLSKEVISTLSQVVTIIDLACENEEALALSSLLYVPIVKVDALEDNSAHKFVMSIRPPYHAASQALFDVMDFFEFSRVAVVYDARKTKEASSFYAKAQRWPRFNIEMIPELIATDKSQTRNALTALRKSHIKEIILFCDHRDLTDIMNEALFVGINDNEYRWISFDLEVAGPNRTYPSILGMLGLTLHVSNEEIARILEQHANSRKGVEYSLAMYASVHDAALAVGIAVYNLMNSGRDGMKTMDSLFTDSECPLRSASTPHGRLGWRLLHHIRKVKFQGLTGEVQFNLVTGERLAHSGFDVVNVLEHNVEKIGSWLPEPGMKEHHISLQDKTPLWVGDFAEFVKCHNPGNLQPQEPEAIPVLKVTTVLEPPFVEKVNESMPLPTGRIPKNLLQGFCMDLIEELSKEANFDYEIYLHKSYGGMVEELKKKEKDIALAPITITADRELVIDFSKPFMDFSMSLIMQKPGEPPIDIFAFLLPFNAGVWLSTIGVVIGMTIMMFFIDYLSPFGYRTRARESDEQPGNEFNLFNSLWFATVSVLQQGPDNTPLAPSGRLLVSAFWFFILILISTYTANLAAFFTIKRTNKTINSLEELENQSKTKYGVLSNGSVQKFFKESEDPLYLKMFLHMREHQTFMNATSEGVRKARNEDYAYITEQPYLEYYNQQKPCNTRLLKNLLQAKGYGIGLQQNSPYTNRISVAILALRERYFIERTRRKWWDERSQCPKSSESKTGKTKSLHVNNMAGVFLVLMGGVIISLIVLVIEIRCKKLVVYFTSSQSALKRRLSLSCEPREESSTPKVTPVRVAVVLSQGDKVLKRAEEKPTTTTSNKLFGRD